MEPIKTFVDESLVLIPLFPLLGAVLWGVLGKKLGRNLVNVLAPGMVFISAVAATVAVWHLSGLGMKEGAESFIDGWQGARIEQTLYTWISVADLSIDLTFVIDPLTAVMAMVVLWVGFIIHVYSVGYMAHDESYWRYFSYLNLFIFSMLLLVLGGSLPVLFVGWEGVGLCSYLLIGFWYQDSEKAAAGLKAFVVNRIGDFGFLIGIFTLFSVFGTVDFAGLEAAVQKQIDMNDLILGGVFNGWTYHNAITFACIALFVGATGKSAQIPLFVWLPDAMAGPTPVSALIHAATMVTAGVYMCVRLNFLFTMSTTAMTVVAIIGGLTAFFAATIGTTQNDIKKVLAYSTVSQLGYMFLAVGVGAYVAAIFHLMTHAFFKACLFLGSGSVIHSCGGEQDMREMGGLHKKMPITAWTMGLSTMAIMGMIPFSGFFSKDEILWHAFASPRGGMALWILGVLAAFMTAFYMWRMMFMTFSGQTRGLPEKVRNHLHESPFVMTLPLIVLAFLAVVGGWIGWPKALHGENYFAVWLDPVLNTSVMHPSAGGLFKVSTEIPAEVAFTFHGHTIEWALMALSVLIGLGGLAVAWMLYKGGQKAFTTQVPKMPVIGGVYRTLLNKYYVDEAYAVVPIGATHLFARFCSKIVDPLVVDGLLTKVPPFVVRLVGGVLAWFHNGDVQRYLAFIVIGVAVTLYFAMY